MGAGAPPLCHRRIIAPPGGVRWGWGRVGTGGSGQYRALPQAHHSPAGWCVGWAVRGLGGAKAGRCEVHMGGAGQDVVGLVRTGEEGVGGRGWPGILREWIVGRGGKFGLPLSLKRHSS